MSRSTQLLYQNTHRLGVLNNRKLFSHTSGSWNIKIKLPAVLVPGENPLTGFHRATILLWAHIICSLWEQEEKEASCVSFSSYRGPNLIIGALPSLPHPNLFISLLPNTVMLGIRISIYEFLKGTNIHPMRTLFCRVPHLHGYPFPSLGIPVLYLF